MGDGALEPLFLNAYREVLEDETNGTKVCVCVCPVKIVDQLPQISSCA